MTPSSQSVMPTPRQQFLDNNGNPCAGCLLYSFSAGTNTAQDTYADVTLATPNANPVVLDSAGRATAFLDARFTYKFALHTAADVPIWTVDSVDAVPSALNVEVSGVAGETLAQRQIVYLSSGLDATTAGRWYLTDADLVSKSSGASLVGVVISPAISAAASGTIRIQGRVTGYSGLSEGLSYFVSATAGELTSTAPANVKVVGVAESPTVLLLTPSAASSGGVGAFSSLQVSSTTSNSIDTAGGIEAGSGNVQVVDATGKIPAIDSTRFANLSGLNLTGVPKNASTETITGLWTFAGGAPAVVSNSQIRVTADTSANALLVIGRAADSIGQIHFRNSANTVTHGILQVNPPADSMVLQVGSAPTTALTLTPAAITAAVPVAVQAELAPPALTTTVGEYAPSGIDTASALRLTATGDVSIGGITPNGVDGRLLWVFNATDGIHKITLLGQSGTASNSSRFASLVSLDPGQGALLRYSNNYTVSDGGRWVPFR